MGCPITIMLKVYENFFQYWLYDFDAFIADVGGYLGLLLGQSLFGAHQILSQWVTDKLRRKKSLAREQSFTTMWQLGQ